MKRNVSSHQNENKFIKTTLIFFLLLTSLFILSNCFHRIQVDFLSSNKHIDFFNININPECNEENKYTYETIINILAKKDSDINNKEIDYDTINSYRFIIKNNNDFDINYDFKIVEPNNKNVNILYRLKINDTYIKGNETTWITNKDLNKDLSYLKSKEEQIYTLEWKLLHSNHNIAINEQALTLKLNVYR